MFVRNDNNARLNDLFAPQGVHNPVRARSSDYSVSKTVSKFFLGCAAISGIAFLLSGSPIALISCGVSLGLSLFFSATDSRIRRYHHHRPDPSLVVLGRREPEVVVINRQPTQEYGTTALLRESARLETARLEAEAAQRRLEAAAQANIRQQQEAAERERALAAAQAQRRAQEAALAASIARAPETSVFSRHMPESSQSSVTRVTEVLRRHETDTQQAARREANAPRPSAPPATPPQTYTRHMPESQQQPVANPPANPFKRHMPESANK